MSQIDDKYTYRITWSEEDQEHVGLCLEFPSLSWLAASPEDALGGIRKVIEKAVIEMQSNGEIPPTPFSGKNFSGRFVVRLPPEVHRDLAMKAAEEGISLNRLISSKLSNI